MAQSHRHSASCTCAILSVRCFIATAMNVQRGRGAAIATQRVEKRVEPHKQQLNDVLAGKCSGSRVPRRTSMLVIIASQTALHARIISSQVHSVTSTGSRGSGRLGSRWLNSITMHAIRAGVSLQYEGECMGICGIFRMTAVRTKLLTAGP